MAWHQPQIIPEEQGVINTSSDDSNQEISFDDSSEKREHIPS